MRNIFLILITLSFVIANSAYAQMYKWTDEKGRVHYTDRPPVETNTTPMDIDVSTYSSVEILPLDSGFTDILKNTAEKPGKPKPVTMYSAEWCGYCDQARDYFRQSNIPFKEYDIDKSQKGKRDYKKLKASGVPVILIGKKRMNGFSAGSFDRLYND